MKHLQTPVICLVFIVLGQSDKSDGSDGSDGADWGEGQTGRG